MSLQSYFEQDPEIKKCFKDLEEVHKKEVEKYGWDKNKEGPKEVVIKPEALDTTQLEVGGDHKTEYRSKTWKEYIGQDLAKKYIKKEIEGCKKYNKTLKHIFLSGPPGHGKTLFAEILASELNKKMVVTVAGEIKSEQQFIDKVVECDGGILFIDEANRISKKVGFFMLPIIEKFEINGQKLKKPFTVIFATTHKGDLAKDLDALIQRFEIEIELEHYSKDQIIKISKMFKEKEYPSAHIDEKIYDVIAKNSRETPRIARKLVRQYIFNKNINDVLKYNRIVKEGLTDTDVKVLKILKDNEKGLGSNNLSKLLRIKPQTYEYQIEPYLIFKDFIKIESRRKLTKKGKEFLKGLNNDK